MARYRNLVDRLLTNSAHADGPLPTKCWESLFSVCNKGYAVCTIRVPGKKNPQARRAHILMWECVNGRKVLPGYTLDHLCRNKRCIRPDHLEEVPRSVNTARMRAHYRRLSDVRHSSKRVAKTKSATGTAAATIAGIPACD